MEPHIKSDFRWELKIKTRLFEVSSRSYMYVQSPSWPEASSKKFSSINSSRCDSHRCWRDFNFLESKTVYRTWFSTSHVISNIENVCISRMVSTAFLVGVTSMIFSYPCLQTFLSFFIISSYKFTCYVFWKSSVHVDYPQVSITFSKISCQPYCYRFTLFYAQITRNV